MLNRKAFLFLIVLGFVSLWAGQGAGVAVEHSGTVCDETWTAGANPHDIVGNVTVPAGCSLTIDPGVEVVFKGNYYLRVAGDLQAQGTGGNPILFTKDLSVASWNYIQFYTNGTGSLSYCTIEHALYGVNLNTTGACTIDHCTIQHCSYGIYDGRAGVNPGHTITNNTIHNNTQYGVYFNNVTDALVGGGNLIQNNDTGLYFNYCDNAQVAAGNTIRRNLDYGVYFANSDQPLLLSGVSECGVGVYYQSCENIGPVDNLTFSNNAGAALQFRDCGVFSLGSNNTVSENGWPLAIDAGSYPTAASQIPTSGNLRNGIQIVAGSSVRTGTWPAFAGLDYFLTGNNTISTGGSLTLSPGLTMRCFNNNYIRVDGQLYGVGTPADPIVFTRHATDSWGGLRFYSGSQGSLQHATFEYGQYGVYQINTGSVPVSNCQFNHNTYGVYIAAGANVPIKRNRFQYNGYGVYIAPGATATIGGPGDDHNCFMGNRTYAVFNDNASTVTAENNYWGDPSGPNHPSYSSGKGDRIGDNLDVEPFPWLCANICECDQNHDGRCDMQDWLLFGQDWGRTDCNDPGVEPCECDLTWDGRCDMQDWLLFGEDWGRTNCPIP